MRVLITGGLGFIGGRLAQYLLEAGHQIIIGSRKISNPPTWLVQAEVETIKWNDDIALENSCNGVDIVIHAAGMNAQDCLSDPISALEFNGYGTLKLLEAAIRAKVSKFIYLSTAHVYSSPLLGTITEESRPTNPHPYATSHLAGDQAVDSANKAGKIQGFIFRLSNGFGAPMHEHVNCWMLLVNDLCKQAVISHQMTLKSSGNSERDFIGLTQVCQTIEKIAFQADRLNQSNLYNIGSGEAQSVMTMAKLIQQRCAYTLGFKPSINIGKPHTNTKSLNAKLTYCIDKINKHGIKFSNEEKVKEIDNLLLFCQSKFT